MVQTSPGAERQSISLELDPDVVRRARDFTDNLSDTIEHLLEEFAARESSRREIEGSQKGQILVALNRLRAEHGSLADDFSPL